MPPVVSSYTRIKFYDRLGKLNNKQYLRIGVNDSETKHQTDSKTGSDTKATPKSPTKKRARPQEELPPQPAVSDVDELDEIFSDLQRKKKQKQMQAAVSKPSNLMNRTTFFY